MTKIMPLGNEEIRESKGYLFEFEDFLYFCEPEIGNYNKKLRRYLLYKKQLGKNRYGKKQITQLEFVEIVQAYAKSVRENGQESQRS